MKMRFCIVVYVIGDLWESASRTGGDNAQQLRTRLLLQKTGFNSYHPYGRSQPPIEGDIIPSHFLQMDRHARGAHIYMQGEHLYT